MYQITYKKRNGEIFNRIRSTLPTQLIGQETSMGWQILDIKYGLNNNFYSFSEYKQKINKSKKYTHIKNNILNFLKKYVTTATLIVLVPLYLIEII